MRRRWTALLIVVVILAAGIGGMYSVAVRDPVVRFASLAMTDWPAGAAPVRVALLTDLHVAGPDMPPARLSRIVAQVNALRPDVVLLGGDFVGDKPVATHVFTEAEAVTPLRDLRARFGVFAVLGNHDHWRSQAALTKALELAGVKVLTNRAAQVGPLNIGGADDAFTHHADLRRTLAAMASDRGARLVLSHSPDVAPKLPDDVTLVLAGHTHCGQVRLPVIGAFSTMSAYGKRYACGLVTEGTRRIVISAGLGTSLLPLRLGAVPDLWLLMLGPAQHHSGVSTPASSSTSTRRRTSAHLLPSTSTSGVIARLL